MLDLGKTTAHSRIKFSLGSSISSTPSAEGEVTSRELIANTTGPCKAHIIFLSLSLETTEKGHWEPTGYTTKFKM